MDKPSQYTDDFYAWTQDQAEALQALRDRRDLPNGLDLDHVIEEIEGVGRSEVAAVQSYLRLILVHLIKLAMSQSAQPQRHWRGEIVGFHADLLMRYSPSMRQNVELDLIWHRAVRQAAAELGDQAGRPLAAAEARCPFSIEEFVAEELDLDEMVTRLAPWLRFAGSEADKPIQ